MKDDALTRITKRVGNFVAKKTKDANNQLFEEISKEAIESFIEEINKTSPALATLIRGWQHKHMKDISVEKEPTLPSRKTEWGGCDRGSGGCGFDTPKRRIYTTGGCGNYERGYGGC